MIDFRVRATGSGTVVTVDDLQAGRLVSAKWYSFALTVALTDAISDAIECCRSHDPHCAIHCLQLPDSSGTELSLEIRSNDFMVRCTRCHSRGGNHANPFTAEDGSAYDVEFVIEAADVDLEDDIAMELQSIYPLVYGDD